MKLKKILTLIIILYIFLIPIANISYAVNNAVNTTENIAETDKDLTIYSEAVTLIDSKSGTIIYSKNADKRMYPASTTKMMTAILVLENGNLDDMTTVSQNAISSIPDGYSTAYLTEGEQISIADLLKVLLIHSANDAANVLAEYISGSIDEFVKLMNEKAKELGCTNTHFTNTNGIHDKNHYSTANDLAIIAQYCMKNSIFRTIVSMPSCTIPATNKSAEREYVNTNDLLLESSEYYRADCIGIKTGYTSPAKNCLIAASKKDDIELICVTLGSNTLDDRYADTNTLFDYGYEVYPLLNIQTDAVEETENTNTVSEGNVSPISTENLFTQSFWDYLIKSDILITILRILLIVIILIVIAILLTKKLRDRRESIDE